MSKFKNYMYFDKDITYAGVKISRFTAKTHRVIFIDTLCT